MFVFNSRLEVRDIEICLFKKHFNHYFSAKIYQKEFRKDKDIKKANREKLQSLVIQKMYRWLYYIILTS
jgi:hypothetical protein